jgi:hypothetical protein
MYIGSLKPTTNRSSWLEIFELYDDETNEPVDLTGSTIVLQFRDPACCTPRFTATVAIIDIGKFQASGTLQQMRSLCAQTYDVGCTIARDDETAEYIVGTIAIMDGIVS